MSRKSIGHTVPDFRWNATVELSGRTHHCFNMTEVINSIRIALTASLQGRIRKIFYLACRSTGATLASPLRRLNRDMTIKIPERTGEKPTAPPNRAATEGWTSDHIEIQSERPLLNGNPSIQLDIEDQPTLRRTDVQEALSWIPWTIPLPNSHTSWSAFLRRPPSTSRFLRT